MSDGHTKEGAWIVKLELTEDQVQQLIRSMEMAKQMNVSEPDIPPTMNMIAHQAFLSEILNILYQAVLEQRGKDEKKQKSSSESA